MHEIIVYHFGLKCKQLKSLVLENIPVNLTTKSTKRYVRPAGEGLELNGQAFPGWLLCRLMCKEEDHFIQPGAQQSTCRHRNITGFKSGQRDNALGPCCDESKTAGLGVHIVSRVQERALEDF